MGAECRILHEHYMKDVSSRSVTHAKSAMAWSSKRTILAQEGLRILLNCSRDLPWYQKARHLSDLTARMQFSGYEKKFHFKVISSAINAYETLRGKENEGERPLVLSKNLEC